MIRPTLSFLITLIAIVSTASADMQLTISEVGNDVVFKLQGSIDTSVFPISGTASGGSLFLFSPTGTSTSGTSESGLISSSMAGQNYLAPNDIFFTPVGTVPSPTTITTLSNDPLFWYGFTDHTPSAGVVGAFDDNIQLPAGYVSGQTITLCSTEPATNLAALGLTQGDFWGVEFEDGTGGTQSLTFEVVPEPSSLVLLLGCVVLCLRRI